MKATEKAQAIELVQDMVNHGWHLMQYKDAEDVVNHYWLCDLRWWQDIHDRWVNRVA